MADIHGDLQETFQTHQHLIRVEQHLEQLNEQLTKAYQDLDRLENQLRKEFNDIENLENLSVKGLFHQVLGSKEQQIDKERQEYLQVSLKYDEIKKTVELLEYERALLQDKIKDIPKLERRLNQLIKEKEKSLTESNSPAGRQILDLLLVMDTNQELIGNIERLKTNGQEIILVLEKMLNHLEQARNWGKWDMAGSSRGSSYLKHNQIDRARDLYYHVKHLLVRFEQDLRHIYGQKSFNLGFEFESFNRFTDIFFDNLISDWIVQKKIQKAHSTVVTVSDMMMGILQSLTMESQKIENKLIQLEEQRKLLIIQS